MARCAMKPATFQWKFLLRYATVLQQTTRNHSTSICSAIERNEKVPWVWPPMAYTTISTAARALATNTPNNREHNTTLNSLTWHLLHASDGLRNGCCKSMCKCPHRNQSQSSNLKNLNLNILMILGAPALTPVQVNINCFSLMCNCTAWHRFLDQKIWKDQAHWSHHSIMPKGVIRFRLFNSHIMGVTRDMFEM